MTDEQISELEAEETMLISQYLLSDDPEVIEKAEARLQDVQLILYAAYQNRPVGPPAGDDTLEPAF